MSAWAPAFSRDTSWTDLQDVIDAWTDDAIENFRAQLAADPTLTPDRRAAHEARAVPIIKAETRSALEAGWRRLRAEAQPTSGTQ